MVEWGTERLVTVEDDSAGMVWAPDAIWDSDQGECLDWNNSIAISHILIIISRPISCPLGVEICMHNSLHHFPLPPA